MNDNKEIKSQVTPNGRALLPMAVFLVAYLSVSVATGDFYKMPITVAFMIAAAVSLAVARGVPFRERVAQFCRGPADGNVMLMVLIFILAGAFAQVASRMGAVDAAVNLALSVVPPDFITVGMFVAACFVSLSVGTSVGTIVALAPIAAGMAEGTGLSPALMLGVMVSGAMFGDNLSFISDTTIVATRTQGCSMIDKFRANIWIALPAAVISGGLYTIAGWGSGAATGQVTVEWIKVAPYLAVLGAALCGVNVIVVLALGIVLCGVSGLVTGSAGVWDWTASMGEGVTGMGELIIITLLAAGVFEMMRRYGGISWLTQKLTGRITSRKGAEAGISALTALADVCTANNTVALIMTGPIAKDMATQYGIDPRRSASLIDTSSCVVQGVIPYGAQMLMAAGIGGVTPLDILPFVYYPLILGLVTAGAIAAGYPRRYASATGTGD